MLFDRHDCKARLGEELGVLGDRAGVGDASDPGGQGPQLLRKSALDGNVRYACPAAGAQYPGEFAGRCRLVREGTERTLADHRVRDRVWERKTLGVTPMEPYAAGQARFIGR